MRQKYVSDGFDSRFLYLDIRAEGVYNKGHIPGSISAPLEFGALDSCKKPCKGMPNDRRLLAGVAAAWASQVVKQWSLKKPAVIISADGGFVAEFARDALTDNCEVYMLKGGYRYHRRRVRGVLDHNYPYIVLAGKTGTGKTLILQRMQKEGYQVLDLESLAGTSGSAFGRIGMYEPQPPQEQFENRVAHALVRFQTTIPIFVEEETRPLGQCFLPSSLTAHLEKAPRIILCLAKAERVKNLIKTYAGVDDPQLMRAIQAIAPRIGEKLASRMVGLVQQKNYEEVAGHLLAYYDQTEGYSISQREDDLVIDGGNQFTQLYHQLINTISDRFGAGRQSNGKLAE